MPAEKKKKPVKKKAIKRKTVKRISRPKKVRVAKPKKAGLKVKENVIGRVTHYFAKIGAAVIKLKANLSVGDTIKVKGHTTDFTQKVNSMQIDHVVVNSAKKGQEIGLLVDSRAREHDVVSKA